MKTGKERSQLFYCDQGTIKLTLLMLLSKIMGLSLKLELKSNNYVLVTNLITQEQIEVTLSFLQKVTKSSLMMLLQYKCYELILEAEKHWKNLKKFRSGKEIETLKEIELEELENIANIRSSVRQQEREKTAAKQQHWNEIAAYNQAQRQLRKEKIAEHERQLIEQRIAKTRLLNEIVDDDKAAQECINYDDVLLQSQKSYNRALIVLEYADYCLEHDYRYILAKSIDKNIAFAINSESLSAKELETIDLKKENQALRERIAELETDCIIGEIVE